MTNSNLNADDRLRQQKASQGMIRLPGSPHTFRVLHYIEETKMGASFWVWVYHNEVLLDEFHSSHIKPAADWEFNLLHGKCLQTIQDTLNHKAHQYDGMIRSFTKPRSPAVQDPSEGLPEGHSFWRLIRLVVTVFFFAAYYALSLSVWSLTKQLEFSGFLTMATYVLAALALWTLTFVGLFGRWLRKMADLNAKLGNGHQAPLLMSVACATPLILYLVHQHTTISAYESFDLKYFALVLLVGILFGAGWISLSEAT